MTTLLYHHPVSCPTCHNQFGIPDSKKDRLFVYCPKCRIAMPNPHHERWAAQLAARQITPEFIEKAKEEIKWIS